MDQLPALIKLCDWGTNPIGQYFVFTKSYLLLNYYNPTHSGLVFKYLQIAIGCVCIVIKYQNKTNK